MHHEHGALTVEFLAAIKAKIVEIIDTARFKHWESTPNGCAELQAMYEAVDDSADCMESVVRAINDGDYSEARRLALMSLERLNEHAETLKGLM